MNESLLKQSGLDLLRSRNIVSDGLIFQAQRAEIGLRTALFLTVLILLAATITVIEQQQLSKPILARGPLHVRDIKSVVNRKKYNPFHHYHFQKAMRW